MPSGDGTSGINWAKDKSEDSDVIYRDVDACNCEIYKWIGSRCIRLTTKSN